MRKIKSTKIKGSKLAGGKTFKPRKVPSGMKPPRIASGHPMGTHMASLLKKYV